MRSKLRLVPDCAVLIGDLGPLDPGGGSHVSLFCGQRLRVIDVRVTAALPQSWIERQARRLPGVGGVVARILRACDAADRAWATGRMKIDHVTVDGHSRRLGDINDLPAAAEGSEISVRVINQSDRVLVARVLVEGVLT